MRRTLLLEIGCEELPTSFVNAGLRELGAIVPEELTRARIEHGGVRPLGTARRLAVLVSGVATQVPAITEEVLGPPEGAARGPDGRWSKAAEGFARKNDVAVDALSIAETPKGRYLRALKALPGGPAALRLPEVLSAVVRRIAFAKSMRWADIETPFGRPVQWLVALFGGDVVPFEFVRQTAGRVTRGHRFLAPAPVTLATGDDYVDVLRHAHVLVDPVERHRVQSFVLESAARAEGGELVRNLALEEEVLGLVEEPFAIVGRFDPGFLALPPELIETVMSHHQRYFAVRTHAQELLPLFVTTVNTALDPATIRKGNENVMRARLADARFFVQEDRKTPLAARVPKLDGVVYHQKLGAYGDKVRRLEQLAPWIASHFGADEPHAARAATLAKADLVTLAVGEFPELQGVMGAFYARGDGEADAVARAIEEHYMPKSAEGDVAESHVGAALAVADRLDTLVGFFAIGQKPSGGGDPFGLRRAALGLLKTLLHHRARISIAAAAGRAYGLYTAVALPQGAAAVVGDVAGFVRERLEGFLTQALGLPGDVVSACLAAGHDDPVDVLERAEALAGFRQSPHFARVVTAFERVFNISQKVAPGPVNMALLTLPAEVGLVQAFDAVREPLRDMIEKRDFTRALGLLSEGLPEVVDQFFTDVFVMVDDAPLREARLALLAQIAQAVGVLARFDTLAR